MLERSHPEPVEGRHPELHSGPERLARLLWRQLLLTPPCDLALVSANLQISIFAYPLPPDLSGLCLGIDAEPTILLNSAMTPGRIRFTWAHELGHYLLGSMRSGLAPNLSTWNTGTADDREADAFAAGLLMPALLVMSCLQQCTGLPPRCRIARIRDVFAVSWEAARRRIGELDPDVQMAFTA
jgi:Zn-dependent peptidase ImmA (M78 family)